MANKEYPVCANFNSESCPRTDDTSCDNAIEAMPEGCDQFEINVQASLDRMAAQSSDEMPCLRLILDVEYELNGESLDNLKRNLEQMVVYAMNAGNITRDGPATVEKHSILVIAGPP